jgi:hypothetical protein
MRDRKMVSKEEYFRRQTSRYKGNYGPIKQSSIVFRRIGSVRGIKPATNATMPLKTFWITGSRKKKKPSLPKLKFMNEEG